METLPQPLAVVFREKEPVTQTHAAEAPGSLASGTLEVDNKVRNVRAIPPRPKPEGESPPNNGTPFDQEARELVKRIEKARNKMKKILS